MVATSKTTSKTVAKTKVVKEKPASKGVEYKGHVFKISDPDVLNDLELLEALDQSQLGTHPGAVIRVLQCLLGSTQYQALKELQRDDTGKVRADGLEEFMADLVVEAAGGANF